MHMRFALTMRVTQAVGYDEPRDSISQDWISYLCKQDTQPILIPNVLPNVVEYLESIKPHLLILSGGDDIGATPERDKAERVILSYALDNDVPVFGVCRGMQLIHHHFGGKLVPVANHAKKVHQVHIKPSACPFYGQKINVNSFHDNGIKTIPINSKLHPFAIDHEESIEGFYHPEKPLAAVMWHPERYPNQEGDFKLMQHLVKHGSIIK